MLSEAAVGGGTPLGPEASKPLGVTRSSLSRGGSGEWTRASTRSSLLPVSFQVRSHHGLFLGLFWDTL